jgi:hypothetical protein
MRPVASGKRGNCTLNLRDIIVIEYAVSNKRPNAPTVCRLFLVNAQPSTDHLAESVMPAFVGIKKQSDFLRRRRENIRVVNNNRTATRDRCHCDVVDGGAGNRPYWDAIDVCTSLKCDLGKCTVPDYRRYRR